MDMKIPPRLVSMNHQAWKPGNCHFCLAWLGLRKSCVRTRTGPLARSLEHGAVTSHLIRPEWSGHPVHLFLFLKIYTYPAWDWAVEKSQQPLCCLKKISF